MICTRGMAIIRRKLEALQQVFVIWRILKDPRGVISLPGRGLW